MQSNKYEHVFPLLNTCDFSPLEHQASGVLDDYSFSSWVFSPPIDMIKLWCDLSLSPFDINFQEEFLWIFVTNGFGPWDTEQSNDENVMLVEDKIHWVELDQKKHIICGKVFFLLWNGGTEWYASVVPKRFGWTENNKSV